MESDSKDPTNTNVQKSEVAPSGNDLRKWYAIQTRSNMEQKVVQLLTQMIPVEDMGEYISVEDIIMPTDTVSEIKNGKKTTRKRKLYPGYLFLKVKLYDQDDKFLEKPWYFIRGINGVLNFMGGDNPVALTKKEVDAIFEHMKQSEGVEKLKVEYTIGEHVKINDGPFTSLSGIVDEVDPEKGKLKVSVSIFGRFTPVELEYWQVNREES